MNQRKKEITNKQTYVAPVDSDEVQKVVNEMIGQCSASVFKNYLPYISRAYDVKSLEDSIAPEETVAFFDITKLVIEEKDKMVEKLKNVYHLLAYSDKSLALIIHRKHDGCQIGLAVGKCQDSEAATKMAESLQDALVGNFPGTSCSEVLSYTDSEDCIFQALNESSFFNENNISNYNSIAVVSNIASQFSEDYINQGIEKVIDGIVPAENIPARTQASVPDPDLAMALEALPEKLRLPLVLCYSEGMSYEEAADVLQIPTATLRGRISRGKAELRKELKAE